ncbi:diacylglycerol/lipid kinase family protein [Litorimonas sp. RW-G-Af-16]|uniref:diacylglycerol/lipid kinase family protein n=1 Tax=Litorimonas sp. RW-G-Af-16 TaxID=3241168 RepID=UPI00390C4564
MSFLAISNAHARNVAKQGSALSRATLSAGATHHITQDPADLHPLFQKAASDNLRHLVIEGGDGTVRTILSAMLNTYPSDQSLPAVSILPSGTTNQIARNIGLKKLADLDLIAAGKLTETTVPMVQIKTKTHAPRYGFLFSTGALPHVSRFAQDKLNAKGVGGGSAVVGAVIKAVTSDRSDLMPPAKHRIKAKLKDQTIINHKGKALGTIMTTLPSLMLGLDPFWGDEPAPLRLTWAEAESQKLGRTVAGLWLGRKQNRETDGFHSHNVDRLRLKTKAPATLDGDFLDVQGQRLKISPSRSVTFWQAAR